MSFAKLDKVVLKKPLSTLAVGSVYQVGEITKDKCIIRKVNTGVALAAVDIDDMDVYFDKETLKGFSAWAMFGAEGVAFGEYRTNGKEVQTRIIGANGKQYRSHAKANVKAGDEFRLFFGIRMAYLRTLLKVPVVTEHGEKQRQEYSKDLKSMLDFSNAKPIEGVK